MSHLPIRALLIIINLIRMLASIDFDAQLVFGAIEIEHIGSNRMLAPEFRVGDMSIA